MVVGFYVPVFTHEPGQINGRGGGAGQVSDGVDRLA